MCWAERLYLRAKCRSNCKHQSSLVVADLVKRLGYDFPVLDVRNRLKCFRCRRRKVTVTVLEPAKQPYRIVMKDRRPFALAGLWEPR